VSQGSCLPVWHWNVPQKMPVTADRFWLVFVFIMRVRRIFLNSSLTFAKMAEPLFSNYLARVTLVAMPCSGKLP
jgi:hypothetical protein